LRVNHRLIGAACGSGLAAKHAVRGGADLILALSSGRTRQMGQGSLAGLMPYMNSNRVVMDFGSVELIPTVRDIPVIFGLFASDPTIMLPQYINEIKNAGFGGINNYPSIGLFDGNFRQMLEYDRLSFDSEVEAIRLANKLDIFTLAFVFDEKQAASMIHAGADIICAHLGLTGGGLLGAAKVISLKDGAALSQAIFDTCKRINPNTIRLLYGGPVNTPADVAYMYNSTCTQGYIGGSTFDRTPSEQFITERTLEFKYAGSLEQDELLKKMLSGVHKHYDAVTFVKEYVATNYMNKISFSDLAKVVHVSRSRLSVLFHNKTGYTFPEYVTDFRIRKACKIFESERLRCSEVALLVGYSDYAHFSKVFKSRVGVSPVTFASKFNSMK